jgi:hypothetical protein
VAARLTALGYYYAYGTNDQRSMLERISDETQKVPECAEGESDCSWLCGDERIETIGDFYRYCVEPHMSSRTASAPQQPSAPSDKKASDVSPKASQGSDKGE